VAATQQVEESGGGPFWLCSGGLRPPNGAHRASLQRNWPTTHGWAALGALCETFL